MLELLSTTSRVFLHTYTIAPSVLLTPQYDWHGSFDPDRSAAFASSRSNFDNGRLGIQLSPLRPWTCMRCRRCCSCGRLGRELLTEPSGRLMFGDRLAVSRDVGKGTSFGRGLHRSIVLKSRSTVRAPRTFSHDKIDRALFTSFTFLCYGCQQCRLYSNGLRRHPP